MRERKTFKKDDEILLTKLVIFTEKDRLVHREGSFAIPLDILEQKLLLHKGLIMLS